MRTGIFAILVHTSHWILPRFSFLFQLVNIGLDLSFYLEGELSGLAERCLRDTREKLIESVKLRALEDKWRPMNFSNKSGIQRFVDDMIEIGITSIHPWIYGNSLILSILFLI